MPKQHFACKVEVLLENFCFVVMLREFPAVVAQLLINLVEDICPGLRLIIPQSMHVRDTRADIQLDTRNPCSILSSIPLFLHQEIHLVEAPEGGTILFLVVIKGLKKADHSNSAFMLDKFTHNIGVKMEACTKLMVDDQNFM